LTFRELIFSDSTHSRLSFFAIIKILTNEIIYLIKLKLKFTADGTVGMAYVNNKYCLTAADEDPCHTPTDFTGNNRTMNDLCDECSTCDTELCNGKKPIAGL
jgi:hypothetical protein